MTVQQGLTCGGLGTIYAKSNPLTTLDEHVDNCMCIMQLLKKSVPYIDEITICGSRIWELLFLSIYFHDIGKASKGFQNILKNGGRYNFRHERLSAGVFNNIFKTSMPACERQSILRAILTHHKSYEQLKDILTGELYLEDDFDDGVLSFETERSSLDFKGIEEYVKQFEQVAQRYSINTSYAFDFSGCKKFDDILKQELDGLKRIKEFEPQIFFELILWGLLKNCDHMGSANVTMMPVIQPENMRFLEKLSTTAYVHQKQCWESDDNILLIAPTGSGKTEAAFGWAFNTINNSCHRHIFYMLPYTASINAMFLRLNRDIDDMKSFGDETVVGLVHGKLRQFIAGGFEDDSYAEKIIKKIAESFRIINKPIKVTTPFQVLKYMFGVKGFEKGIIELAGAILIYDEIHAYDKEIFLKILWSLDWLQKHFKIKIFITTATLPTFLQKMIMQTLGLNEPIKPDVKLLRDFTRHKINLMQGTIEDGVDTITEEICKGKKVLVVCNTVDKSQEMYRALSGHVADGEIALLHSRFVYRDRNEIEKEITAPHSNIRVLIGTQAIEVSLDIDYDILFTEPAPLDALLQRFGRINRKRQKGICLVNVFTQGGKYDTKIYDSETVKNTIDVLYDIQTNNEGIIYEENLQSMMDKVYSPWDMEDEKVKVVKRAFYSMMDKLLPYREHRETEEEFERQFNTIEVLPQCFFEEFIKLGDEGKFIEASMLTCQLQKSKLYNPKVRDNIKRFNDIWVIECKYDSKMGLLLSEAESVENFL